MCKVRAEGGGTGGLVEARRRWRDGADSLCSSPPHTHLSRPTRRVSPSGDCDGDADREDVDMEAQGGNHEALPPESPMRWRALQGVRTV